MPAPDKPSSILIENMRAEMQHFVEDVYARGGGKVSSVEVVIGFDNGEAVQLVIPPGRMP